MLVPKNPRILSCAWSRSKKPLSIARCIRADQQMYRFIGIEPARQAILVNKSSVHFRADFAPIAQEILVCKAPGPMLADPSEYPWRNLREGIRLKPQGMAFAR